MYLSQLIYASEVRGTLTPDVIRSIYRTATEKNPKHGIAGVLFFDHRYFIQCIEGDRDSVSRLYHRIAVDERHSHSVLLLFRQIARRDFGDWSMGLANGRKANRELFLRYGISGEFTPMAMSGEAALGFLRDATSLIDVV